MCQRRVTACLGLATRRRYRAASDSRRTPSMDERLRVNGRIGSIVLFSGGDRPRTPPGIVLTGENGCAHQRHAGGRGDGTSASSARSIGARRRPRAHARQSIRYQKKCALIVAGNMPDPTAEPREVRGAHGRSAQRVHRANTRPAVRAVHQLPDAGIDGPTPAGWLALAKLFAYNWRTAPRVPDAGAFSGGPARRSIRGGTAFGRGFDVPGMHLRNVIITKLPFSVPDQPLAGGRSKRFGCAAAYPFRDYRSPRRSSNLKQGFGRLIRSSTDRAKW